MVEDLRFPSGIDYLLCEMEQIYGRGNAADCEYGLRMANLVLRANAQTGKKVVLLFDEYDAPILDTMPPRRSI